MEGGWHQLGVDMIGLHFYPTCGQAKTACCHCCCRCCSSLVGTYLWHLCFTGEKSHLPVWPRSGPGGDHLAICLVASAAGFAVECAVGCPGRPSVQSRARGSGGQAGSLWPGSQPVHLVAGCPNTRADVKI